ncbi:MAG: LamG-like jellyroll fold domain-containing protein, partial [Phycisphaerae bacterium]
MVRNIKRSLLTVVVLLILCGVASADIGYSLHLEGVDPSIASQVSNSVAEAVEIYNRYGSFNKWLNVYYNVGVPTAQANFDGVITFGGSRNTRVALHEMGHTMGVGTFWQYPNYMVGGVWQGAEGRRLAIEMGGYGDGLHGDGMHIWPWGLNYDNEDSFFERINHVRIMAAMRSDMGIMAFTKEAEHQTAPEGGSAVFTVQSPLATSYRWHKNGIALEDTERISGVYTNELTIKSAQQSDAGSYFCSADGAWETLNSRPRLLTVNSLSGMWKFNNNADDITGSFNAAETGNPLYVAGISGNAISLDGLDDYITLPAGVADVKDMTVSCWVYWRGGGNWQRIIDFGDDTNNYVFLSPSSGTAMRLALKYGWGTSEQILETAPVPTEQWVHVAAVLQGDSARLYVNGRLEASADGLTINPTDFMPSVCYVGKSQYSADPLFNGNIDELRLYNYGLSDEEVVMEWAENAASASYFTANPARLAGAVEGGGYSASLLNITDPAGASLSFTKLAGPSWLDVSADGTVSGAPVNKHVGVNELLISADDGAGGIDYATVQVEVANANDVPYRRKGRLFNLSAARGESFSASLHAGVVDPDMAVDVNEQLTFTGLNAPDWLTITADGKISGVPSEENIGANEFTAIATDSSGATIELAGRVLVSDIKARYKFNNDFTDSMWGAVASASGSPTFAVGNLGNALNLDGSDDYLTLPAGSNCSEDMTFTCWLCWNGGGSWQRIFDFGSDINRYIALVANTPSSTMRLIVRNGGDEQSLDAPMPAIGQWVHVAVKLRGSNGAGRIFINGEDVAGVSGFTIAPDAFSASNCYIGKSQFVADPFFNGFIDDFRIYCYSLSLDEIRNIYNGSNPRIHAPQFISQQFGNSPALTGADYFGQPLEQMSFNPDGGVLSYTKTAGADWLGVSPGGNLSGIATEVGTSSFTIRAESPEGLTSQAVMDISVAAESVSAYYKFETGAEDSAGFADGEITGAPELAGGVRGKAIFFDGVNDYVQLPEDVCTSEDMVIAAWIKWLGGRTWQRVFDFGSDTSNLFCLIPNADTNTMRFVIRKDNYEESLDVAMPPVGEWTHVAVKLRGSNGACRIYINGEEAASGTFTLAANDIASPYCFIGKSMYPADPTFNGA